MPQLGDILKAIHAMDIILVLIIAGFALMGFAQGAVKVFIVLAAIYAGFLVAAIYYLPVADLIQSGLQVSLVRIAQVLAFLFINAVVTILLILLMYQFFGHMDVQGRLGACLGRPLGMLLGFLAGVLLTGILVILLQVPYEYFKDVQLAGDQAPYLGWFHDWYGSSVLAPRLRDGLPILLSLTTPLLGGNTPPLLVKPPTAGLIPGGLVLLRQWFG